MPEVIQYIAMFALAGLFTVAWTRWVIQRKPKPQKEPKQWSP